jgi:hypothetical protein
LSLRPGMLRSLLALALFCALNGISQEWTRFRGPNGTGISHAKGIPTKITAADQNWHRAGRARMAIERCRNSDASRPGHWSDSLSGTCRRELFWLACVDRWPAVLRLYVRRVGDRGSGRHLQGSPSLPIERNVPLNPGGRARPAIYPHRESSLEFRRSESRLASITLRRNLRRAHWRTAPACFSATLTLLETPPWSFGPNRIGLSSAPVRPPAKSGFSEPIETHTPFISPLPTGNREKGYRGLLRSRAGILPVYHFEVG